MFKNNSEDPKSKMIKKEHEILDFWSKNKIFEKLQKKNQGKKRWSFLDGPITANNPMGVHHAWGRTYKDLFQRYKAMQGFAERYQNGFDCQGLWVEVEVEKELGFRNKKDIEKFGVEKFVNLCKERVLKYSKIQTDQSIRLGQWMDWKNSYYTMSEENNFAIWHFLKKCFEKGYLYKGRDSVPWCPRCGTAISQHEILTEEYKELVHDSVYLEFPIAERDNEFLLVWTTTPWTLPGNVAVAVDPQKNYVQASGEVEGNLYYLGEAAAKRLNLKVLKKIKGRDLVGLKYSSPFDNLPGIKKALGDFEHRVIANDPMILPITDEEGTGLVHTAPGAGSEDFRLGKKLDLPVIKLIDEEANYIEGLGEFSGKNAKNNPEVILDYLKNAEEGKFLFDIVSYKHRYPTCWRCKTELVWRVVDEWYISMDKLRGQMVEVTKKIKWLPEFGLSRELDWLKNMQDWLISKKRYWGLALPIYECPCGNFEVIGSKEELKERAVEGWEEFEGHSPHKPWIDKVKIKCSVCGDIVSRIPDVGNPWLDAGIIPFSTLKYFEDKNYWENWYPAEFICESFPGQFKNWFYSLIAMSTVLENSNAFRTVLGYASVKDEKGEEMHKSKGNAIWFDDAAEKMGVDVMRWMYLRADPYKDLLFGYMAAEKIFRRFILIFKNVFTFYDSYSKIDKWQHKKIASGKLLDRWILSKSQQLVIEATHNLNNYHPSKATQAIEDFVIKDLSTWYLRRSRKRRDDEFYSTMDEVLNILVRLLAPFIPFLAEDIYQHLKKENDLQSVHLCDWPKADKSTVDEKLIDQMVAIRKIVEFAHKERADNGIKLRQPLHSITVGTEYEKLSDEFWQIIKEETNVEMLKFDSLKDNITCILDMTIDQDLMLKGLKNEIIREIQQTRKEAGLWADDKIKLYYQASGNIAEAINKFSEDIKKSTNTSELVNKKGETDFSKEINVEKEIVWVGIKKIHV